MRHGVQFLTTDVHLGHQIIERLGLALAGPDDLGVADQPETSPGQEQPGEPLRRELELVAEDVLNCTCPKQAQSQRQRHGPHPETAERLSIATDAREPGGEEAGETGARAARPTGWEPTMKESAPSARTARTSASLVVMLVPTALVASGFGGRHLGRGMLLLAAAAAIVCLVASVSLVRSDAWPRSRAWLLIAGTISVLGGGSYLSAVGDVPAAIPIFGVLAVLLGLVLLATGALALRPPRAHADATLSSPRPNAP